MHRRMRSQEGMTAQKTTRRGMIGLLIVASWILGAPAFGTLVFHEDFGTTGGELVGPTLGDTTGGWNDWYGSTGYTPNIAGTTVPIQDVAERVSNNLSYTSGDGILIDGGSIAMDYNRSRAQDEENTVMNTFTGTPQTGDVFLSFLLNITDDGDGVIGEDLGLMVDGPEWSTDDTSGFIDGVRNIGIGVSGASIDGLRGSATEGTSGVSFVPGQTHFLVARFGKDGGSNYQHIDLWVDPTLAELTGNTGFADITVGTNTLGSQIDTIGLSQWNMDRDDTIRFDEMRVGTAIDDVYVVPEPSSLLLVGLALAGGFVFPRRRG